jgi:S1-C subfamily serine protease
MALSAAPATALPLQDLLKAASPSVVHLSLRDDRGKEEGSGSGFVISEDGQVATNFHVAEGAAHMVAIFADRKEVEIVGLRAFDEKADVAVLQLAKGHYPALRLAAKPASQGDDIVVIGSPLGLGHAVSSGIVSAVREHGTVTASDRDGQENWGLQITASIAPGSSGSPIINGDGEVIGLAVGEFEGTPMYFGVPVAKLQALLDAPATKMQPLKALEETPGTRSVRKNLLISAAFLTSLAVVWWIAFHRRSSRPHAAGWNSSRR